MNYCVCEDLNNEDILQAMADANLSHEQIKMLVHLLELGEYLSEFDPMSAERMLFIHSNVDYNFTAKELNWLTFTSGMLKGQTEVGVNIFAFEMACSSDDYYIPSAALIKIFNVAFPGDNLFVFKVGPYFSIGCKRTFLSESPNNFCISALLGEDTIDVVDALIDELSYAANITDYPSVLLAFSPQENTFQKSIDQGRFDPDYLIFLDEIQSMYGVDTSSEKERYIASFSDERPPSVSYRAACDILYDIAVGEEISSFDFLDAAMVAEERALRQRIMPDTSDDLNAENTLPELSEEAYKNAEVMLTEMLEHPPK